MDILTNLNFSNYIQWLGILSVVFLLLTIVAFFVGWGFRFRLVGITSFIVVLTIGLFGLGLGLFTRIQIPGAVQFSRVYDNGGNQVVIVVPPSITPDEVEPTLKQAASDYFSYGRVGPQNSQLTIRLRTILHPEPGITEPLYLGQVKRSLAVRDDENLDIELFSKNVAKLPNS
jgi:hypothetical protein